jgi:mevalonate kinase
MVEASAPGKVHLIGEHAVVYGEPAIIAAVGMRTYVEAKKSEKCRYNDTRWDVDTGWFCLEEIFSCVDEAEKLWKKCHDKKDFTELFDFIKKDRYVNYRKAMIGTALKRIGVNEGVTLTIRSDVPIGSGLGSSSSLSVAMTKAITELFNKKLSLEQINDIAFEQEKLIHGTPSGGDNSASCFGGLVWFQKSQPINIVTSLREEIPYKLENFVLVYIKPPEKTTGELVQLVRNLDEDYRNERVKRIGKLVFEMKEVLKNKNFEKMKEIVNENQRLLAELGVSCKEIDEIAKAVQDIGGAAKLCGAGGGGVMLCYHKDKERLTSLIKDLGFEPWETELAAEGMRIER